MDNSSNEIDLIELLKKITKSLYVFFTRRYKIHLISGVLGLVIGTSIYFLRMDLCEYTIIGTSQIIPPTVVVDIINNLNVKDKIFKTLLSDIGPSYLKKLKSIKADTAIFSTDEAGQMVATIKVKFVIKGEFNRLKYIEALVAYIDSNEYIKEELLLTKNKYQDLITKYNEEINNIDSLQNKILASNFHNYQENQGKIFFLDSKIENFFNMDVIRLEREKLNNVKALERIEGFTIIDGKFGEKTEIESISIILKFLVLFIFIGIIYCLILDSKSFVKNKD